MSPGPWLLATSTPTPKLVAQHLHPKDKPPTHPTLKITPGLTPEVTSVRDSTLVLSHRDTVTLASSTGAVASMSWDHRRTQLFVSFERGFRSHIEPMDDLHQPDILESKVEGTSIMHDGGARTVVGFTRVFDWRALLSPGIVVELPVWINPTLSPLRKTVIEKSRHARSGQRGQISQSGKSVAKAAKAGVLKYSTVALDRTWPWVRFIFDAIFLVLVPAIQLAALVIPPPVSLVTSLFTNAEKDDTYYTVDVPDILTVTSTTAPVPDENGWLRGPPEECVQVCGTLEGSGAAGKVYCADTSCSADTKPKPRLCPAVPCLAPPETELIVADAREPFELSLFRSLRLAMLSTHVIPSAYLRGGAAEHALHTVTALAWAGDTSEDGLEETPEVVGVSDTVCMKID